MVSLVSATGLHLRCWGEEAVVFDEWNGRTQLIAHPADLLLLELLKGSCSHEELAKTVAAAVQISTTEASEYVIGVVKALSDQGLVALAFE